MIGKAIAVILAAWDWWIYRRAFHSIRRMCECNGGWAFIMKLHIDKYLQKHPISPELEQSARTFYETIS